MMVIKQLKGSKKNHKHLALFMKLFLLIWRLQGNTSNDLGLKKHIIICSAFEFQDDDSGIGAIEFLKNPVK